MIFTSAESGIDDEEDGVERVGAARVVVVVRGVRNKSDPQTDILVVIAGTRNTSVFAENLENYDFIVRNF